MDDELLSLKEAARRYDIDYRTLRNQVQNGAIPGLTMPFTGRHIYVRPVDVEAALTPTRVQSRAYAIPKER